MKRIYVASSWRNKRQDSVVAILRAAGHAVYDFKNPTKGDYPNPNGLSRGFHWAEIDQNYKEWQPHEYVAALEHPLSDQGFTSDMGALHWCDTCVLVLPCGRSAHAEAGWAAGSGRDTYVLMEQPEEPELMYKMFDRVYTSLDDIVRRLG